MRYRLLVWDFDGTLADSLERALELYNRLAVRHGFVPVADPHAVRQMGTLAFLKHHRIPLTRLPSLVREFLAAQRDGMDAVRLFADVPAALREARGFGYRMGILSSNTEDNIRACLRANGVEDLFEFVIGYPRLLGKGRALRRLLKRESLEKRHLLYIGDEARDVEAAREAGVDIAGVGWGMHTLEFLAQHGATYLASGAGDLLRLLREGASNGRA